jgi:hypothetical protein
VKNDGFDNEDSDYILYVNDILGSEETGHKYVSRSTFLYSLRWRLLIQVSETGTLSSMSLAKELSVR